MWRRALIIGLAGALTVATLAAAQQGLTLPFRQRAGLIGAPVGAQYDGAFRFCRLQFRNTPEGDGGGWFVDYPRADQNLSDRFGELTKVDIHRDAQGAANHIVVTLLDDELFRCPFVMMTEPGGAYFDQEEAARLREYLLKGGFLWSDDSWGSLAWDWWTRQIQKALPPPEYRIVDLEMDHQVFHTLFDIDEMPQTPNVGLWVNAHQTSERGFDSPRTPARAIMDGHGRIMVFMTHNTDFGDSYEEESLSPDYFRNHSVKGYAIGIDLLLYAMTH
jgi:hypothetical protein